MKVLLTTLNSKYSHTNISLYYLKKCIDNLCDCNIKNYTINDELNNILADIFKYSADVVCFGCYIWNIEQTLKICKNLKALNKDIKIILGGPEVSYNPDEILKNNPYISSVICGEAENSIKQAILDVKDDKLQKTYNIPVNICDVPDISDDIILNYDNRVVYFETSRGCPYRCSYCLSCIDKKVKYFDINLVFNSLKKLLDKNVNQIKFLDRTFNSNKKRALEIWNFLLENRKNTTFHFEICVNLMDEEVLDFLKTVPKDVFQFEIGIQSTNEKTLNAINRTYNFEYEKEMLIKLRSFNNIHLHTDLIIGLPYEDLNTFKKSFNDLYSVNSHKIQIGFLKFLKGTNIYIQKDEFDYIYDTNPPYEIFQNKFLSYNEICFLKKFEQIFEIIHSTNYFQNFLNYDTLKEVNAYYFYEDMTNYFDKNKLLDRKISIDEVFLSLINKYKESSDFEIIVQLLTYDYFLKFKGTRDWFFDKYDDKKESINEYIDIHRESKFGSLSNLEIHKKYKFCILDYDVENNIHTKKIIYYTKK
jgi:radical SAM superfamily enzyme YgiQ (UPF0313 family)